MPIVGYASKSSLLPGEKIDFFLSTDTPGPARLNIRRVGGGLQDSFVVFVPTQVEPTVKAWEGFGWSKTATLTVPNSWATGLYYVEDATPNIVLAFVVRPIVPAATSSILFQIAFITEQAYNSAGTKSLYSFNSLPGAREIDRASVVSFDRPGGYPFQEEPMIRWLEQEGISVEYASSFDLHSNTEALTPYQCLLLAGHDEYWTQSIRNSIERFVQRGGNLAVFSGNTGHRHVRLEGNLRKLVFYKYAGSDPVSDSTVSTVGFGGAPLNRSQQTLLGAGFTWGAFGGRFDSPMAYKLRFPQHWVMAGVTTPTTAPFMTYETDAAAFEEENEDYPRVTGEEGTPLSFVPLGTADLRTWIKPGFATMGIYSNHGTVFHGGSTDWPGALSDPTIAQITRNVLIRFSLPTPFDWEDIGHANDGRTLAALDTRLYLVTNSDQLWRRYPVGADVPWREIGIGNQIKHLTYSGASVFGISTTNAMFHRASLDVESPWTAMGNGPAGGTRALAAAGGSFYAIDSTGALWRRSVSKAVEPWQRSASFTQINTAIVAMTSFGDVLLAATSDGKLLRSDHDLICESIEWKLIRSCPVVIGLGVIQCMLYAATTGNRIVRLDLHGMRVP